jgi:hypothetical protein
VAQAVAGVCAAFDVTLDGGITYLDATDCFEEILGGTWLHYGGQRGRNDLSDAQAIAIVASPTLPPDAIMRKTRALWANDLDPINAGWTRIGQGTYVASDERLQAVNRLHGHQELYQAIHRCRPILKTTPATLLIFSPWDVQELGFSPHYIVTSLPHGNSKARLQDYATYQARRRLLEQGDPSKMIGC